MMGRVDMRETVLGGCEPLFKRKQVYEIIIPLILEQVFMAAIGMFDVIMVSGIGEEAISAVSLVDFINQLVTSVLTALSTGGAIVCSQYLGRNHRRDAEEAVQHLVMLVVFAGSAVMLVAFLGNYLLLRLIYGAIDGSVMGKARVYFALSGFSYPFVALFCCSAAVMRTLGYTKLSFHTSLVMNLLNIVMNALFIYGFGWGVFGAGLASLLSRMVISLALFSMVFRAQDLLKIQPVFKWRLKRDTTVSILNFAIPTSLESSVFYIGRLLVQGVVTGFGTSAIAANAVALTVTEFLHMPGAGIGIGMITIVGRCIGADEKVQAREYANRLIRLTYLLQGICCAGSMILAGQITGLYHLTAQTKELAVMMLLTHGVICAIFWPMGFTTANALKAAGDVRFTMMMSIASMWCFRVGGSYLFVRLFPSLGVLNVWLAMYCDWIARACICLWRFRGSVWLEKKVRMRD